MSGCSYVQCLCAILEHEPTGTVVMSVYLYICLSGDELEHEPTGTGLC